MRRSDAIKIATEQLVKLGGIVGRLEAERDQLRRERDDLRRIVSPPPASADEIAEIRERFERKHGEKPPLACRPTVQ